MSKMGQAVQWIQEQGLENDPDALKKYLEYRDGKESKEPGSIGETSSDGRNGES